LLILLLIIASARLLETYLYPPEILTSGTGMIRVTDGDSFQLGARRLRLNGIDAPEYHQTCQDANGRDWECGKAARASLEALLRSPNLKCEAEAQDQYGRSIATCNADDLPDIAAAQVSAGMAVSHEYYGVRSYGDEEDAARSAKRGIWTGNFTPPSEWRAAHPALRTKTQPAE
jgi:endonuclease YncB( thermonuclease family)